MCYIIGVLKISQYSQENACLGSSLERLQHGCFPVKYAKLLSTPFFTEQTGWLLLK